MRAEIYILSCERPELLACTLGSVCGFNAGLPVHVIDDGSRDGAVMPLLARYREAGLIESVDAQPHGGVGRTRRRMIQRFLDGGAEQLVQIEADVLVGPGQVRALLDAYAALRTFSPDAHFLNVFHHHWVRPRLSVTAFGGYRVGITKGGSEPFWTADRESLARAVREGLLPAERPDLVLWLAKYNGATLSQPEISCQHLGAGKSSLYYSDFAWQHVVWREQNERLGDSGPLRQPFPQYPILWPEFERDIPSSALALYEYLRRASPLPLPEFPK